MLSLISHNNLINWSVRFLLKSNRMRSRYPMCELGKLLSRNHNVITIDDNTIYKRITIKLYGMGICLRDELKGRKIGTKRQCVVSAGQFVFSKIDARNGAFGLIPKELDGAITTADFVSFNINTQKVIPDFLRLLMSTKRFAQICQRQSSGTTGRQRMSVSDFLQIAIPCPNIKEQLDIVHNYDTQSLIAENFDRQAKDIFDQVSKNFKNALGIEEKSLQHIRIIFKQIPFSKLTKWAISENSKSQNYSFENANFPCLTINDLIEQLDGGKTPSTGNMSYWLNGNINWASAKDMKHLFLDKTKNKITKAAVDDCALKTYSAGTIIAVFRSGILRHSFPVAMSTVCTTINQDLKAIKARNTLILSKFLLFYLYFMQKLVLEYSMKIGVTVESIDANSFLQVPVVVPPISAQQKLVNIVESELNAIGHLRNNATNQRSLALRNFQDTLFE